MARIFGSIKSERNEKHQIGNEWIESSLTVNNPEDKSSAEYVNVLLTLDEDGKEKVIITVKEGINYVLVEECKSREVRMGRYNFHALRTSEGD